MPNKLEKIPKQIQSLVYQRNIVRQQKDWSQSDILRQQIEEKGYQIDDTPYGTMVRQMST